MKKMLKYDFLDNYVGISLINGLIFFCIICVSFFSRFSIYENPDFIVLAMTLYVVLFVSAFFWVALIFLAILNSINKKLFTFQGYLTFSLPLSIDSILISKILINVFWIVLSSIALYIALYLGELINPSVFQNITLNIYRSIFSNPLNAALRHLNILSVIVLLLVKFLFILSLLNIGKIKKHPLITGIFIFIGIQIVLSFFEGAIWGLMPNYYQNPLEAMEFYSFVQLFSTQDFLITPYLIKIAINVVEIIFFYWVTKTLIKNKLELE